MARKAAEQNDNNDEKDARGGANEDTQPAVIPSRVIEVQVSIFFFA